MHNPNSSSEEIKILALIVCYFPEDDILLNLVDKLFVQVNNITVLDNGGINLQLHSRLSNYKNLNVISFGENKGIASALNHGFELANKGGYNFVITFDQDSDPSINMVSGLVNAWSSIRLQDANIGAIGPKFYDSRGGISYPFLSMRGSGFFVNKIYSASDTTNNISPVDLLITSGMLVPVSVWLDGNSFDDDLFVDYVDTEWCFRLKQKGFQHYGYFGEQMNHRVSDSAGFNFFGIMLLRYSSIRRYFYYRNTIKYLGYNYVPMGNKLRILAGLIFRTPFILFLDSNPLRSLKLAFFGVIDGFKGNGGPLPSKYLN